jgi:hypothetical protein
MFNEVPIENLEEQAARIQEVIAGRQYRSTAVVSVLDTPRSTVVMELVHISSTSPPNKYIDNLIFPSDPSRIHNIVPSKLVNRTFGIVRIYP